MKSHEFETTMSAYDNTQCNEEVKTGDILIIKDEGVVGVSDTWPIAVTVNHGQLHVPSNELTLEEFCAGLDKSSVYYHNVNINFAESFDQALKVANDLGYAVNPFFINPVKKVRKEIAMQLFAALDESNRAGIGENDLLPRHSSQGNLYGYICEAIKTLGYEGEYWHYVRTSELPTDLSMSDEESIISVLNSDMFDNDVYAKIEYIMSRNSSYDERELLEMYDNL